MKACPALRILLEPTHRPQPRLQPAVIALDRVVGELVGAVQCRWHQCLQHARVDRRLIGGDLDWRDLAGADRLLEEPAGRPMSRRRETITSITWPNWSTARYA
jgi:hypothetical protein